MRALVCNAYGSTDDLRIEEWDDPIAGDHEVVVDVIAAGLNFPDLLSVAGKYQDKIEPPFIPGNEAAGVISAIGPKVQQISPADRVIVLPRGSAFAEKCCVHENDIVALPDGLDFERGAGFGVTYGTSYHALQQCANLLPGECVLVLGAAGGVGTAAVEIAKAMGARVIAAASNDEKLEHARSAGAEDLINYSGESLRDAVKTLTAGNGVDVVVDPVGGELALQALRALSWHGRYLVIGFASGDIPSLPANMALLKEASIIGVWWGTWMAKHPQEHADNMQELAAMLRKGTLAPKSAEVFALSDYKEAFRTIGEQRALGKVVLSMKSDHC